MLDDRMFKYKLQQVLGVQRRFIFFLPGVDDIDEYIRQKLEDKAKQKKLKKRVRHFLSVYISHVDQTSGKKGIRIKNAKSITKMISALVMSVSFLLSTKFLQRMLKAKAKSYKLAKAAKEKARQKKQRKQKIKLTPRLDEDFSYLTK